MNRFSLLLLVGLMSGCSSPTPSVGDPSKKISWTEYQKMDAEQKEDPYVVDNLDDDAKKRLADLQKKKKKR